MACIMQNDLIVMDSERNDLAPTRIYETIK